MAVAINKRKCPAQKDVCKVITACRQGAISYVVDEKERMGGKIVIDVTLCNDCGICVEECCGHAIELMPG